MTIQCPLLFTLEPAASLSQCGIRKLQPCLHVSSSVSWWRESGQVVPFLACQLIRWDMLLVQAIANPMVVNEKHFRVVMSYAAIS